jgi:hypothetical protein
MIEALFVFGLATWRMGSLLAKERGPLDVFLKIREISGVVHDNDYNVVIIPEKFFAQLISCVWCNSMYIGAFWALLFLFTGNMALFLALPFALSAVAVVLSKVLE